MKKRYFGTILAVMAVCALLLSSCGGAWVHQGMGWQDEDSAPFSIVTTMFAPFDFVREIATEQWSVTMLIPPGAESHSFEPTPQDLIRIKNCDIFIYVGGESDTWLTELLKTIDNQQMHVIRMMDLVDSLYTEAHEQGHGHEHAHEYDQDHDHDHEFLTGVASGTHFHEQDEHVWTTPVNAMKISQGIADVMAAINPEGAENYQENVDRYHDELHKLDAAFRQVVAESKRQFLVFGDRFPFRYFVEEYGLEYLAAFSGCTVDTNPSAATLAFLIEEMRAREIPVVLTVELSNQQIAHIIQEEIGAKVMEFHAAHNITAIDFYNNVSYVDIMYRNVEVLRMALN